MRKITLLFIALFIFGCSNGNSGNNPNEYDFRTGTTGLELNFVQNSPPDKIYSGNDLDIMVEVKNMGAYPTTDSFNGKMEVYGFDERAFSGERWEGGNLITPRLQGRSQFNPQGGRDIKRFHSDRVGTLFNTEIYEPTIIAAACYKYKTIAAPNICIDPDPYSQFDEEKVCTIPQGGKTYSLGSQGAPVAVTKVEEQISSKEIHFGITIQNVGKGKVVAEEADAKCPTKLDYNDRDKVYATVKLSTDSAPKCQPRGDGMDPVRLDDKGNGFIFCTFRKPDAKSAFETQLEIQLDYRYMDWISKKLKIVNIDR